MRAPALYSAANLGRVEVNVCETFVFDSAYIGTMFPKALRILLPLAVCAAAFSALSADGALAAVQIESEEYERTGAFMERFGRWSYVVAPLFMVVVAILPIPAEFPAMLNGMMFGAIVGTTITWLGALVGAVVSFELARRFGRPLSERVVSPGVLQRADRLVDSAGWPGLLTLRLIPAVAFTAINWGAGFTSVTRWRFVWTTAVGILPGAIAFTASGTGLAVLLRMHPVAAWGVVLMAILALWWTVARYRRRPMRLWTGEFEAPTS